MSFQADGTLLTILTDFRTNAQILRLIIPGEEELNEPRAQSICFISSFNNDLISPEAVMKLRLGSCHFDSTSNDEFSVEF